MPKEFDTNALAEQADDLLARGRRFKAAKIDGLCGRCQHAQIVRARRQNEPTITCDMLHDQRMPPDIEECNKFEGEGTLSIWNLAKLAKVIDDREGYKGDYR